MKKIIALTLALSLCLGLSVASFAQPSSNYRKLYLANRQLEDTEPYVEDDDAPVYDDDEADTGSAAAPNTNLNPGTGR